MNFRILVGRQAIQKTHLVNPGRSYICPLPEPETRDLGTAKKRLESYIRRHAKPITASEIQRIKRR